MIDINNILHISIAGIMFIISMINSWIKGKEAESQENIALRIIALQVIHEKSAILCSQMQENIALRIIALQVIHEKSAILCSQMQQKIEEKQEKKIIREEDSEPNSILIDTIKQVEVIDE